MEGEGEKRKIVSANVLRTQNETFIRIISSIEVKYLLFNCYYQFKFVLLQCWCQNSLLLPAAFRTANR